MVKGWVDRGNWGPIEEGSLSVYPKPLFGDLLVYVFEADQIKETIKTLKEVAEKLNTEASEDLRSTIEWVIDELRGE